MGEWCWKRHNLLAHEAAIERALKPLHEDAAAKRDEIIRGFAGQPKAKVIWRIEEKVGPMLDEAGRFLRLKPVRPIGIRRKVLQEAAEMFHIGQATIDKIWKHDTRLALYAESLRDPHR